MKTFYFIYDPCVGKRGRHGVIKMEGKDYHDANDKIEALGLQPMLGFDRVDLECIGVSIQQHLKKGN